MRGVAPAAEGQTLFEKNKHRSRIAAVDLPALVLQAAIRAGEVDPARPVVMVVRRAGRVEVCAASGPARVGGVAPGHTLAQARALLPDTEEAPADPERARALLLGLAEALLPLAPAVELAPPEALLLDASGAARLTGETGPSAEAAWSGRVLEEVAAFGLCGRLAVGDTPEAARLVAGVSEAPWTVLPPGGGAAAVAGLTLAEAASVGERFGAPGLWPGEVPSDERPLWPEIPEPAWALLGRLGLDTLGALLRLPEGTLATRLGPGARALLALASGGRPRPLRPWRPPEALVEAVELEPALEDVQGLVFVARPLVERLAARLLARGRTATRLVLDLELDAAGRAARGGFGPRRERRRILLEPARPVDRAGPLLELLRDRLGTLQPEGPVCGLALEVVETAARGGQICLGDRPRAREALESVLSRLAARCGEEAVGALRLQPRWLPEQSASVAPFAADPPGAEEGTGAPEKVTVQSESIPRLPLPARPLRLRAPEEIHPACSPEGAPRSFEWMGRRHRVLGRTGPERLSTGWWDGTAAREYFTLTLEGGLRVWVFRDPSNRWWIQGLHD